MGIILPKLNSMSIEGFNKIFKEDIVEIDFSKSLNILLGGNGLGKTTILQCIVYALTGGTNNPEVETLKEFRWDNSFFKKRVNAEQLSDAKITIEFYISQKKFTVTRGLQGIKVIEFLIDDIVPDNSYEELIIEFGNYDNFNNFVFVVNRLLYLPENRRSLMWDYDAQVRTLMILSNDLIDEKKYRCLRAEIKNMDSSKRHTIVKINKMEMALAQKEDVQKEEIDEEISYSEQLEKIQEVIEVKKELGRQLQELLDKKNRETGELKDLENRRKELADEIQKLSDVLRRTESDLINRSIHKFGSKQGMFMDKALNYGICPCCGKINHNFRVYAKNRIEKGECLVCGNQNAMLGEEEIDIQAIQEQLQEKMNARDNVNKNIYQLNNRMKNLDEDIYRVRQEINSIDYDTFVNADRPESIFEEDDGISELELVKLISDRQSLENDIQIKQKQADDMYQNFLSCFEGRSQRLSEIYEKLATDFMGKKVTLEYEKSTDKFVDIKYLIPKFDDEVRKESEDCSEAQRFFLDIAFRMALIALNGELTKETSTFICETPESALDISYVKNVVDMFSQFINKNTLIISNNLQRLGLAQELTSVWSKDKMSIFDLLEHGKLSEVQKNSEELFKIRDEILNGGN